MALNVGALASLVVGAEVLITAPAIAAVRLAAAALGLTILVRREKRSETPLIPLDLLRANSFRTSVIASMCCFAGVTMGLFALPFHLQHGLGRDTQTTGLYMTAWPLTVAIVAPPLWRAGLPIVSRPAGYVLQAASVLPSGSPPPRCGRSKATCCRWCRSPCCVAWGRPLSGSEQPQHAPFDSARKKRRSRGHAGQRQIGGPDRRWRRHEPALHRGLRRGGTENWACAGRAIVSAAAVFDDIETVIPAAEREAFMARYKAAAGLAIEALNAAPPTIAPGARVRA
ncbi:MAG: hypothetical protein IPI03_01480 [Rubrivivax sp.]|nr:hypothetical protein [Rubrivivax sp.]MBK7260621.1 hypothetical protein [Rubrivivax sp.]MBK8526297.1 hypothetical protein [Rubrivivax sp.]